MTILSALSRAVCIVGIAAAASLLSPTPAEAGSSVSIGVGTNVGPFNVGVGYSRGYGYRGHGPYRHGWSPRYRVGLFVPILPIGYSTYWHGGSRYYAYDDVYYVEQGRGYRVVDRPNAQPATMLPPGPAPVIAAPPRISEGAPTPSFEQQQKSGQLYAYPLKGQSESSATFDRIECETVGSKATGFNPGQSSEDAAKKAEYTRAVASCLESRGYRVQ
jgi:hypothetical protein